MPSQVMWNGSVWVDVSAGAGAPGATGSPGANGTNGTNGWSPVFAVVADGARSVLQVSDWTGGTGTKPTTGQYVGATGLVTPIASAVDIRGATGPTGTGSTVAVQDEAVAVGTRATLNFIGTGVSAVDNAGAGRVDITIAGANPIVSLEQDLGATPAKSGRFTLSDAAFLAGQELYIQMSADLISTKGTRRDESEMDMIDVRGSITAAGTATVYWSSRTFVKGRFRFNYRSS